MSHENVLGVVPVLRLESSTLEKALAEEEILEVSRFLQKLHKDHFCLFFCMSLL
jgi:hypothetical protein